MTKLINTIVFASVMFMVPAIASAELYTGSLQYTPLYPADSGDGLWVGPSTLQWKDYIVTLEWTVTDTDNSYTGFPWKYTYHFYHNGNQAGFSHMIIEASDSFTSDDVAGLAGGSIYSITTQKTGPGNPNMPEDLYGIKFNPPTSGVKDWTVTFFSDRGPVWGDFYARCGGGPGGGDINFAYNYNNTSGVEKGFLSPDVDPAGPPANGSLDYHILRPDTVPEPSSMILLVMGGLFFYPFVIRRRF